VRLFAGQRPFFRSSSDETKYERRGHEMKKKDDAGFLRDIVANPNDPVPRLIYADWLDEQGDQDHRGEFLRLDCKLAEEVRTGTGTGTEADADVDEERTALRNRLAELRETIDPAWLALLDRTGIENCGRARSRARSLFEFECPRRWEALRTTPDKRVRFCDSCKQRVYHCASIEEAQRHARRGHCVALDSRVELTPVVRLTLRLRRIFPRPRPGHRMGRIRLR
jgi:uncharacterized protein (TIGR02996 family)